MSDDAEIMEAFSAFFKQYKRKSRTPDGEATDERRASGPPCNAQLVADDHDPQTAPDDPDDVYTAEEYLSSSSSKAKKKFHVSMQLLILNTKFKFINTM